MVSLRILQIRKNKATKPVDRVTGTDDIRDGVPDIASLGHFWSRIQKTQSQRLKAAVKPTTESPSAPRLVSGVTAPQSATPGTVTNEGGIIDGTASSLSGLSNVELASQNGPGQVDDEVQKPSSSKGSSPSVAHSSIDSVAQTRQRTQPSIPSQIPEELGESSRQEINPDVQTNSDSGIGMDMEPDDLAGDSHLAATASSAKQHQDSMQGTLSPYSKISSKLKGKVPVRTQNSNTVQAHVPLNRLERLRRIKLATSDTIMTEQVQTSNANRERLRNFATVLASPKDQITLFGKQLPLCRCCLVQVTQDNGASEQAIYICVQGLRNAAEIRLFHSVMSKKRYKPIYDPLKLCYEVVEIVKSGRKSLESSSKSPDSGRSGPISSSVVDAPGGLETFHQILYTAREDSKKTYCGAKYRSIVNGRRWISTIGGLVEVDGITFAMTCEHNSSQVFSVSGPSVADTLVDDDFLADVDGPLVFSVNELLEDPDDLGADDDSKGTAVDNGPLRERDTEWIDLDMPGATRRGPEWQLVPVETCSVVPNFVELKVLASDQSQDMTKRFYIEEVSEPVPGNSVLVATGHDGMLYPEGKVAENTSFLMGDGMPFLEIWTVLQEMVNKGTYLPTRLAAVLTVLHTVVV